jgi:hypothetical protein
MHIHFFFLLLKKKSCSLLFFGRRDCVRARQVCLAAHEHLMHAFALILVPAALLAFLGLVGVWGTLQHQWLAVDAPDLVAFGRGLLGVATPLVCAPLLVWGGLASGAVEPPLASFLLAALLPGLTAWTALPRAGCDGRQVVGSAELKLLAVATAALPSAVHVAMHYQVGPPTLLGPTFFWL